MGDPARAPDSLSIDAFATRLGVDPRTVRKAIHRKRLEQSIAYDTKGHPFIADVALAEQEWGVNRDPNKVRGVQGPYGTMADEKKRLVRAQTRKLELANKEKARQLVSLRAVEMRFATHVLTARDRLLSIPSRAKHQIPHLTPDDLAILDALIREGLEELTGDGHGPR